MADVVGKQEELLASAARTATTTSAQKGISNRAKDIGIKMITTAYTSGTFTAKLQSSWDGGTTWADVAGATTSAVNSTGVEVGFATANCSSLVRAVVTGATTPSATNQVFVIFNEK
jgi:hypothetical protein